MIYTVTFNPCLDYIVRVKKFVPGSTMRTESEQMYPGGKGINVSIVLQNLGYESRLLGFTAGFTGDEIIRLIKAQGCKADFIPAAGGVCRINVKIKADKESEINGQGVFISEQNLKTLYQKLDLLHSGDTLILAGSIPNSLPPDVYEQIMARLASKSIRIIVDATKDLLLNVLKYHPFLIKPNQDELSEMFGVTLKSDDEIIEYGQKLRQMGAQNVLISLGKRGAIFLGDDGSVLQSLPPEGKAVNTVGSGDSMVAGFLAGYLQSGGYEEAFKMGLAAGSASAFLDWLAGREEIEAARRSMEK